MTELSGRGLKAKSAIPDVDLRLRDEADVTMALALVSDEIAIVAAPVAMPARNWRRLIDESFMTFLIICLVVTYFSKNPYVCYSGLLIVNL